MPIAMQRSDAVQIVPATIQTTPAKMIARQTRLARTLSLITRYAWPEPDLNRQTTPAATAMAVTQQLPSHLLTQHTIDLRRGGGGGLRSLAAFTGRSCIRPGNRPSSGIWNLACPALRGRTSWHSVRRLLVRPDQVPTGDRAGFQNRNISRVARPGSGLRSFRSRGRFRVS